MTSTFVSAEAKVRSEIEKAQGEKVLATTTMITPRGNQRMAVLESRRFVPITKRQSKMLERAKFGGLEKAKF